MRLSGHPAVGALIATCSFAGCASENHQVTSEERACEVLQRAAIEWCLSRTNLEGRYWCDAPPETPNHYVLALRYYPAPEELVGSSLIGWYAVSNSDGAVFNYDITNEELTPLASGCPFELE